MMTSGSADCSRRDVKCKLFGGEGTGAGVESRAVSTKYSWTHLNALPRLWKRLLERGRTLFFPELSWVRDSGR